jgi:hypothetical protein
MNHVEGKAGFDGAKNAVVIVNVEFRPGFHESELRTKTACLAHQRTRAYAVGPASAHSNAAGSIRHDRHDDRGTTSQFRACLLLDGSEIGIEVQKESGQRHDANIHLTRMAVKHLLR